MCIPMVTKARGRIDGMDGGHSLLGREDVFLYELYVCLNESIDDLLGHRSRDFHEEKSKKKKKFQSPGKAVGFPFFSIIPPKPIPSLPAGGCKFSFTFF